MTGVPPDPSQHRRPAPRRPGADPYDQFDPFEAYETYRDPAPNPDGYRDPPRRPAAYAQQAAPRPDPYQDPHPKNHQDPYTEQPHLQARWFDDEAGPVVRLYALTRGRARPVREVFDLLAQIATRGRPGPEAGFGPEHTAVLDLCDPAPRSVADLAADCGLPLGVVRVILSDLLEAGCVRVSGPTVPADLPDERILREVINGLRAL